MKKELLDLYSARREMIKSRLEDFKNLRKKDYFKEFLFCLLTPQSNAQKCWQAVEQLIKENLKNEAKIEEILKTKTRFYRTKAKRILNAPETFQKLLPLLNNPDKIALRNQVHTAVNGYGLKEASHFLRNIGKSDNKIAILDRHILRNLEKLGIIQAQKSISEKTYLEIEQKFLQFSKKIGIPIDHLDLLFWSKENGKIFK